VRIAEREMYLARSEDEKIARGLEIGLLCRDSLSAPTRALQAFERVLEIDAGHDEAMKAAAELYAQVADWPRHVAALERRIARVESARERSALLLRIGHTTAERLRDPKTAFVWYRRAHEQAPDATTMAELRRAAEAYGLWRELAEVYEAEARSLLAAGGRGVPEDVPAYVTACRMLAGIAERRLEDRERAMIALRDASRVAPHDEGLVTEADRIALEGDDPALWRLLLTCLSAPLDAATRDGRVAIHIRCAHIHEERLSDPRGAVEELLRAFAWAPDRDETRQALYGLAERTRRWNDVVAVEAALCERATTDGERVQILRRQAQVIEDHLHERVRAYRTHLTAFLMAPEDSDTVAQVWRLAREIGTYRAADRLPQPAPPAAHVEPPDDAAGVRPGGAVASRDLASDTEPVERIHIDGTTAAREPTQELSASDLLPVARGELGPRARREDSTIELELRDLMEDTGRRSLPATQARTGGTAAPSRPAAGDGRRDPASDRRGPPPPPPRRPLIQRQTAPEPGRRRPAPGMTDARAFAAAPRSRLPRLPQRAYESAWEEFATAYDSLPTTEPAARLRHLFRAAEIWETGAEDLERAFDALQRTLELAPDDAEPRARLHRLASEHAEWDRLATLYQAAAENAGTAATAAALLMEVGAIRSQQGRPRETEVLYRRVLGIHPDNSDARERLEALYRSEGRWVDLAASLEERTDPRLGVAAPEAERPPLLSELASIYDQKIARPRDALDALERLRTLAPEDLEVLAQIASISERIGRWSNVIDVLDRIAEVAGNTPTARDALRRIGAIYEREIELPDRAIDAYRTLAATFPDDPEAYAALDRLYQEHARWDELSDTLRRRVGLTEDARERTALLQRRARVFMDWLGAPEEAASSLRHARTIDPGDASLVDDLIRALTMARREREAAAVLEGRIDALVKEGAAAGDIAALLIRLAGVRAEQLGDRRAAREALDRALLLVPDHPTALAAAARLVGSETDPRAYAEARLREAEATRDVEAKVAAYLEVGAALRDRAGDMAGARAAFERALELAPANPEATWGLAGLIEEGGELDAATALLERRLELPLEDEERARVLTQLAALARRAGLDPLAERHVDGALALAPGHLPALVAKADLLQAASRYDELETFLEAAIPRVASATPETRADLDRRLALAYEARGRDDDAYQTLLSADRLHRGDLRIKLALGENRYRARRWREAALHLSTLADHPGAQAHAAEAAEGLYHAALAEIRSLRPDKAEALYARALALAPGYTPALHAMAELAMEKGETEKAAELLTRQALATTDFSERARLFEALGDLAVMALCDENRGRECYEEAIKAADPLESRHVPLLEKLLTRQRRAPSQDHAAAGRTEELIASFSTASEDRAARYTAAAQSYLRAGETARAQAAAERAVAADPFGLTAVTVVSQLMLDGGQFEEAAAVLARALSSSEPRTEVEAQRQAELWRRLGAARRARGDLKGAVTAFEKTIEIGGAADTTMAARRELLELWDDDENRRDQTLAFWRTLAAADQRGEDVLALARALSRTNATSARIAFELARAMGQELGKADRAFLDEHAVGGLAADEAYRGTLGPSERARLIADGDDGPLGRVFASLWKAAPLLWSEIDEALARSGIHDAARVTAKSKAPAAVIFPHVAKACGLAATVLYSTAEAGTADAQVVCVSPPLILLGPRLGREGDPPNDREIRFVLGRVAELSRPERIVAAGLPREKLSALLRSLCRAFAGATDDSAPDPHDTMLKTTLPVKVRQEIEAALAEAEPRDLDLDRYLGACRRAADRAGLVLCGDIATALRLAGGPAGAPHLVELAVGEDYSAAVARLGHDGRGR
jgi:tetratricopeptide (TPR) repeat protein